jgi:hypothetical protein
MIHAKAESRPARASLAQEVAAIDGSAWLAYSAPAVPYTSTYCWQDGNSNQQPQSSGKVSLEGFTEIHIFVRVEARRVNRIRTFSPECEIDAGDLPVTWLTGVTTAQSVAFLKSERAVDAIGPHLGPEADAALEDFVTAMHADKIRRQAAFWLGSTRKQRGVDLLTKMLRDDPSPRFREDAVFALSRAKEGIPVLIGAARQRTGDKKVREKAMFWLARSEDPRAKQFVEEVLAH